MEVHHHSHSARKKWTHYLWEFLMLFLAVFCGFIAENQREHYVEHLRAKRMAVSLISDLQADTTEIHLNRSTINKFFQSADVSINELRKSRSMRNDTLLQQNGVYNLFYFNFFDSQMGNYEQMKNSGALRYFKFHLVNMLTDYETDANRLLLQKEDYMRFHENIITPFIINTLNSDFLDAINKKEKYTGSPFITEPGPEAINQWKNIILMIRKRQEIELITIEGHEKKALELIDELKHTYHLD